MPRLRGSFWSDHREIDLFTGSDREQIVRFAWIRKNASSDVRDARVPRRTYKMGYRALLRQLPDKRVLPRAAADNEYLHVNCR